MCFCCLVVLVSFPYVWCSILDCNFVWCDLCVLFDERLETWTNTFCLLVLQMSQGDGGYIDLRAVHLQVLSSTPSAQSNTSFHGMDRYPIEIRSFRVMENGWVRWMTIFESITILHIYRHTSSKHQNLKKYSRKFARGFLLVLFFVFLFHVSYVVCVFTLFTIYYSCISVHVTQWQGLSPGSH